MQNNENVFIAALEPLAIGGGRRSQKRRSSILKTIEPNGNDERRASRRISWAPTYQYKELLADGTAVIKCQELNSLKTDETPPEAPIAPPVVDTNVINSSDFINRLKAKQSLSRSIIEEKAEEEVPPKRTKKNGSKGLQKYLNKHYDTKDEDDVETVFNTSYNKYGRQVVPRTDQLQDFTQLFTDDNNAMNVTLVECEEVTDRVVSVSAHNTTIRHETDTQVTIHFSDEGLDITECKSSHETTDAMNITAVESEEDTNRMSLCDTTFFESNDNHETINFTDECLDLTECLSSQEKSNAMNVTTVGAEDNSDRMSLCESISMEANANQNTIHFTDECLDITKCQSPQESTDATNVTLVECEEVTEQMSLCDTTIPEATDNQNTIHYTNDCLDITECKASENDMSLDSTAPEVVVKEKTLHFTDEGLDVTECKSSDVTNVTTVESEEDTNRMSLCDTNSIEVNDNQNTLHFTNDCLDITECKSSEEANNVTNVSTVESQEVSDRMSLCDTTTRSEVNDNQNTIHFTNDCLDVTDCKSSRETTQCLPQKLNKSIIKNTDLNTKSKTLYALSKPLITTTTTAVDMSLDSMATEVVDKEKTIHFTDQCLDVTEVKSSQETTQCVAQKLNKSIIKNTDLNNRSKALYALSKPLMTTTTPNRQLEMTGRLNLTKTVFKTFGFDMTDRLRQKRNEFEAKRRQSVVTTGVRNELESNRRQSAVTTETVDDIEATGYQSVVSTVRDEVEVERTQPVVPTDMVADKDVERSQCVVSTDIHNEIENEVNDHHTLVSNKTYDDLEAKQSLSVDLFGSKSNLEDEDMDIDDMNETVGDSTLPRSTQESAVDSKTNSYSESKSESNCESKRDSNSETNIDSNSESKSDSNTESMSEESMSEEKTGSNSEMKTTTADETLMDSSSSVASLSSTNTSLVLNSTSPLSISVIHTSGDYLVSSPTTIDPTLNFTFNEDSNSSDTDSFDPFIHTNRSFHTNTTFYETASPLQLSFMVRDDTLCILADELERLVDDIVLPEEDQNLVIQPMSSQETEAPGSLFSPLRALDAKQLGLTYETLNDDKCLISYLWGTFALEIRFGDVVDDPNTPFTVRHIKAINMKSLVSAEEPLKMRQKGLLLGFDECHKPLITIAHDLIVSSFQTEEQHIKSKHKTSASLHELVSHISMRVHSAKKLLSELRIIASSEVCRLYPKVDDCYRLVVEVLALRKPIQVIIPINPKSYPDEVIHPKVRIPKEDRHLYCMGQFSAAFLRIESRQYRYIQRLIKGAKVFIRAKKRLIYEKQQNLRQKQDIQNARLTDSILIATKS